MDTMKTRGQQDWLCARNSCLSHECEVLATTKISGQKVTLVRCRVCGTEAYHRYKWGRLSAKARAILEGQSQDT